MDRRDNKDDRNLHLNGRIAVFAIMAGFCILAIIEIIYGQVRLKEEKERLALEEQNYQLMQTLKAEEDAEPEPALPQSETAQNNEQNNEMINTKYVPDAQTTDTADEEAAVRQSEDDTKEYDMQIVFLGDSILDGERGPDGVAALIAESCNAKAYNLAIGGSTAALRVVDQNSYDDWHSLSLLGVVNAMTGNIDRSIFKDYEAGKIMENCDFSETDYFVIEYGVNDYLAKIPISKYLEDGGERNIASYHTYAGALDEALTRLHDAYPNAQILVISPHYCQIFSGETFLGDGYSLDYGYGTLVEYMRVCGYVAEQHKQDGVIFYNAFEQSEIDAYTADKYLEDGIHLTAEGRRVYAEHAARLIMADFRREE